MLNAIDFKAISDKITNDEEISKEETKELLDLVYGLDLNLVILQNALELAVFNSQDAVGGVAEEVLKMSGRTDKKAKARAAKYAAGISSALDSAVQQYLFQASQEAEARLQQLAEGNIPEQPTTTEEDGTNNE